MIGEGREHTLTSGGAMSGRHPGSAVAPGPRVRVRRMVGLGLPIVASMAAVNLATLIDAAMVGTLGDAALAAVGVGGVAAFMVQSPLYGISVGVQAIAARRVGERRRGELATPLNAALVILLLIAPAYSLILMALVPDVFPLANRDPSVIGQGVPYLQYRLLGTLFLTTNLAFRGYWTAVDRPRRFLVAVLVAQSSNVVFNYVLIFGKLGFPSLGVAGAGIGTSLAYAMGTLVNLGMGLRHARSEGFLRQRPSRAELTTLARLAAPNGVQQGLQYAAFTALFVVVGWLGTREVASSTVLVNVFITCTLPCIGLSVACTTLVGQALGSASRMEARRWGRETTGLAAVVLAVLGLPLVAAPDAVMGIFIHDSETIALARTAVQVTGGSLVFEAVHTVLAGALLGAGEARKVMWITAGVQWGAALPAAWLAGVVLEFGLTGVWATLAGFRLLAALMFGWVWERGQWGEGAL